MSTTEHLERIKARCEQLLAIAEKRTPGKWKTDSLFPQLVVTSDDALSITYSEKCDGLFQQREDNARFIASCAGPAEAGWRATIAAIDDILTYWELHKETDIVYRITAAWPEELL